MIKLSRVGKPAIFLKKENEWLEDFLSAKEEYDRLTTNFSTRGPDLSGNELATLKKQVAKAKAVKEKAEAKYRHPEVRDALKIMFNDTKCAYCESQISHISYPHIEHFRPKSKFPELCFDWDNLLVACGVCNDTSHKGTHFPDESEGGPLVNPVEEDPDAYFTFEFNPATLTADVIPINHRGECTELLLGLNRYELVKVRSEIVNCLNIVCEQASIGNVEAIGLMKRSCLPSSQYSAFARAMAKAVGLFD